MNMSPKIYTITMVQKIDLEQINDFNFLPTFGDKRCVGYYSSLYDAINAIKENAEKLHNYTYDYCIIEEVTQGIYKDSKNRYIYKWQKDHYVEITEPLEIHNVYGFSMG